MKAFAITQITSLPNRDEYPFTGYNRVASPLPNGYGAYIFSGTQAQLAAINALPGITGICVVSESENSKWPELDDPLAEAVRTKLNTWLSNRDWPTIPADWTCRQVITAIYQYYNENFVLNAFDIKDV